MLYRLEQVWCLRTTCDEAHRELHDPNRITVDVTVRTLYTKIHVNDRGDDFTLIGCSRFGAHRLGIAHFPKSRDSASNRMQWRNKFFAATRRVSTAHDAANR